MHAAGSESVEAHAASTERSPSGTLPLLRWLGMRAAFSLLVLLVLSIVVFAATTILPGNVVDVVLGQNTTPDARAEMIHRLHLDVPPGLRYLQWLAGAVHFDFGDSLQSNQPVWPTVAAAFGRSLILAAVGSVVMIVTAVFFGLWSALSAGRFLDRVILVLSFLALSMPEFVLGALLIWIFAIVVPVLPALSLVDAASGIGDWARMLVLPVITVVPVTGAYILRTMRSATLDVLNADFVRMAKLRGLPVRRIVWRHVLPNALVPMINVLTLNMGWLVGGIVVVEVLFQYPGVGKLLLESVQTRDIPMVQAGAMLVGTVYVTLNLVADVVIALLDPRVGKSLG
jgi:peptide/nickel transport system permease protein